MAMSEVLQEITKEDWRELGFFYEQDENEKHWNFIGSRSGLLQFTSILDKYCSNPQNDRISEHDHLGPYMYLKIVTMDECVINENGIYGSIEELKHLSNLVRENLFNVKPYDRIIIDNEYSLANEFDIVLDVREDGFDPASADSELWT